MSKQRKRPPGSTFTRGMEFGTAAYISIAHLIHVSVLYNRQECLTSISQDHSYRASHTAHHTAHNHHSILYLNTLYYIFVYYTCLPYISHPLFETSLRRK